ncbi:immunoglobulin domain-containing protein [Geothrix sp.]|uniref:immunoglobulin domain-containing protein n=1 Tax=Geothrix sp. TaxID=1962974 RepID=UPI0025B96C24|nr:immunoglobulin domain-containing protein [Geothrix sp.]
MRPKLRPATSQLAALTLLGLTLTSSAWGTVPRDSGERRILSIQQDRDESTHTRFLRTHQGLRVWGGDGIIHSRTKGGDYLITDPTPGEIPLNTSPSLTASEALWIVSADLNSAGPFAKEPKVELVVLPQVERFHRTTGLPVRAGDPLNAVEILEKPTGYRLAYFVEAAFGNSRDGVISAGYLVDAHDGSILRKWNALQSTLGTGNSQYNGTVTLSTTAGGPGFELRDLSRAGNATLDLGHSWDMASAGSLYADADNVWGDGLQYAIGTPTNSTNGQTAAVDAHFGTQVTWDFYQQVLGRNGIDGKGTPTRARVHFGSQYDNAFWWNECFCLTFGDGDKFLTLTALDVVGHEFSHGVTSTTANLVYMGESGSLNEATSDILGTMVEFYARGAGGAGAVLPDAGGNWTIGEQMKTPAFDRPLRYMYKPSLDGMSPDAWSTSLLNLDVHYGSGPMNRCFYFLSQGAASNSASTAFSSYLPAGMTGIGNDRATRIWYRALATYLTSSSNYLHARMAALRSAIDLYGAGSAEYQAVRNAFAAINVGYASGLGDDLTPPMVSGSVSGSTGMIALGVHAQDNTGVGSLIFYVDQQRIETTNGGGQTDVTLNLSFDSRRIPKGSHVLTVVATDSVGNTTRSAEVPFSTSNAFYELLLQGDFEYGSVWDGGIDKHNMAWVDPQGIITGDWPGTAYLGRWCAAFCGLGDANTQSIHQTITIPAEAQSAVLTFWLQVFSQERDGLARDTFQVQVRSAAGELIETLATYSNLDRSLIPIAIPAQKDYFQRSLDLSAYRGKTIQLWFEGKEDAAHPTPSFPHGAEAPVAATAPLALPWPAPERPHAMEAIERAAGGAYTSGVGLTEFLLDNVSLRIGEVLDAEPPIVSARGVPGTFGALNLTADVSDNLAITRVDFLVDGQVVGTATHGPRTILFDSRILSDGAHALSVNAYDQAGNKGTSPAISFQTDNTFSQLLNNPSFDFGDSGWAFANWGIIFLSSIYDPQVTTMVGNGGSTSPSLATLSQRVTIPLEVNSAKLKFSYGMQSLSNPPDDALKVQVWGLDGSLKETLASFTPPGTDPFYGNAEVDLKGYRGQEVIVALVVNALYLPPGGGIKGLAINLDRVDLIVQAALPPTIRTQPLSQSALVGASVTFSVDVSGTSPLTYQWRKDGSDIPGATNRTFTLAAVREVDAGSYEVRVSNGLGTVASSAALLTVTLPPLVAPAITTQPQSQSVTTGTLITLGVSATGSAPLAYQWRKDGSDITGATSSTFTVASAQATDAGNYQVRVANAAGSVLSSVATVTVTAALVAPTITTQPQSQSVTTGTLITLGVSATGSAPLAYQWRKDGSDITGATSSTFTVASAQATDAGNYQVRVANAAGSVLSSVATVTVTAALVAPTITTQPQSQSAVPGSAITFSVTATGSTPLSYQWRKNDTDISAATAPAYTFTTSQADHGARFSVRVTNGAGSAISGDATLTVSPKSRDLNGDGIVNVLDLAFLMRAYAPGVAVATSPVDLNGDGFVDDVDLALLIAAL